VEELEEEEEDFEEGVEEDEPDNEYFGDFDEEAEITSEG
jgi:hypothetical protein